MMGGMELGAAELIPAALQLGSALIRKNEQDDVRDRMVQRQQQLAEEQAAIARQNAARVAQTTTQLAAPQQQENQQADTAQLTQEFTPTSAGLSEASYQTANPGAPKEIGESMAASIARALDKGKAYAKTTAAMSALNRGALRSNIALGRSGSDIGINNNFAQGAGRVADQDMSAIYPNSNMLWLADLGDAVATGMWYRAGQKSKQPKDLLPGGVGNAPY